MQNVTRIRPGCDCAAPGVRRKPGCQPKAVEPNASPSRWAPPRSRGVAARSSCVGRTNALPYETGGRSLPSAGTRTAVFRPALARPRPQPRPPTPNAQPARLRAHDQQPRPSTKPTSAATGRLVRTGDIAPPRPPTNREGVFAPGRSTTRTRPPLRSGGPTAAVVFYRVFFKPLVPSSGMEKTLQAWIVGCAGNGFLDFGNVLAEPFACASDARVSEHKEETGSRLARIRRAASDQPF
jgi:hypothetical protein